MTMDALSIDALRDAVGKFPDDGLASSRRAALDHLRDHGLPTTRHEDWKYTDLSKVVDIGNRFLEAGAPVSRIEDLDEAVEKVRASIDAYWLVIANGQVDERALAKFDIPGIDIARLSESEADLSSTVPLTVLNTALLSDGLRIRINTGAELNKPLGLLIIDDAVSTPRMSQTRFDIEVAKEGTASFIEYHTSLGEADHYANSIINLTLGERACTHFVRIQDRDRKHNQTGRLTVTIGREAEFDHCAFDFGGALIRNDLTVDIAEPGSQARVNGLYLLGGTQHIDNHTRADHRVGPAISRQEYRGILTGNSRGVWNGKAIVHDGADGTDAEQANHNLLLSDKAEVDAKPELEIYADDVKCSHGTTIGQLDEAALFYLRTRGLDRREAKQLLTRAFAQAIVSKSPIRSIDEMLTQKIADRLGELMQEDPA